MKPLRYVTVAAEQILRLPQVGKVTGIGRSMIDQLEGQRWLASRVEQQRAGIA